MNNSKLAVFLTSLILTACATQPTGPSLGEMLDQGATLVTRAQLVALLSGKTLDTLSPSGQAQSKLTFLQDGTFTGTVQALTGSSRGAVSRSSGKWTVDVDGKWCLDERLLDWNMRNTYCQYIFMLQDKVIRSESSTDRNARVFIRERSDLK